MDIEGLINKLRDAIAQVEAERHFWKDRATTATRAVIDFQWAAYDAGACEDCCVACGSPFPHHNSTCKLVTSGIVDRSGRGAEWTVLSPPA